MSETATLLNASTELLALGYSVRFRAPGTSMGPTIRDGEAITVAPVAPGQITWGDVVAYRRHQRVIAHRVVRCGGRNRVDGTFLLRGDAASTCDDPVAPEQILGKVVLVERRGRRICVSSRRAKLAYTARGALSRARRLSRSVAFRTAGVGMRLMKGLAAVVPFVLTVPHQDAGGVAGHAG